MTKNKRLDSYARWRLSNALDRLANCIPKVVVTVETDGQVQLKCRVVAQVLPDQYVIVTGRSNDMLESIDTAIDKLARSIERVVDKQNEQKRETWPPNDWAPSNRAEPPVAWSVHFPAE